MRQVRKGGKSGKEAIPRVEKALQNGINLVPVPLVILLEMDRDLTK